MILRKITEFNILERCLFTYFKPCLITNISVSGPILQETVEEFAKSWKSVILSNGLLENIKKVHDWTFNKIWKSERMMFVMLSKRVPFSSSTQNVNIKKWKISWRKTQQRRYKMLLCVNSMGTETVTRLLRGESKQPLCFTGSKSLPMDCEANKQAWMIAE